MKSDKTADGPDDDEPMQTTKSASADRVIAKRSSDNVKLTHRSMVKSKGPIELLPLNEVNEPEEEDYAYEDHMVKNEQNQDGMMKVKRRHGRNRRSPEQKIQAINSMYGAGQTQESLRKALNVTTVNKRAPNQNSSRNYT